MVNFFLQMEKNLPTKPRIMPSSSSQSKRAKIPFHGKKLHDEKEHSDWLTKRPNFAIRIDKAAATRSNIVI